MKKSLLPTLPVPPELAPPDDSPVEFHFPPGQRLLVTMKDLVDRSATRLFQGTYVNTQKGNVHYLDTRGKKRYAYCTDRYKVIITPVRGFLQFTLP